jgi:type IV secretory pathway VirJ component
MKSTPIRTAAIRRFVTSEVSMRALLMVSLCALQLLGGSATAQLKPPAVASEPANPKRLSHGRFENLIVYAPTGAPKSFVLLLSGDAGWDAQATEMAQQMMQRGAMVAGIDLPKLKANLAVDGAQCVFPDGDLENLSHFLQAYYHLSSYHTPVLVGYGAGAAFVYAVLAQAPRDTFASALTLNFCPDFNTQKALCKGSGLEVAQAAHGTELVPLKRLGNPWVTLQREQNPACPASRSANFVAKIQGAALVNLPFDDHRINESPARWAPFDAAFESLAPYLTAKAPPPPSGLSDLPLIEIPAKEGAAPADSFAILMSGDGGWAGLDQDVAAALSAKGIPVVGLDSLRYYWTARTPEGVAGDTDRMIRYYLAHFAKTRVLLVGYSQGADVLPFAINRLPAQTRSHVALAAIMGMSEHALFEFHLTSWISDDDKGPLTLPEVDRITGMPVLCIYGEDEHDSLCPKLDAKRFIIVKLKGGHHFDGDYANLATQILDAAKPAAP